MLDLKSIIGIITIVIGIYAYYPYIRDILKGNTKPHIFSWIIFTIMDSIGFLIQFGDNAGPGAWGILTTGIGAFTVFLLALKYGEINITKSDIGAFILALVCIMFYVVLENPYYSQIMIFLILLFAMYPTVRKTYHKPQEETLSVYTVAILRSLLSILATINISFLTIGLSVFIILLNSLFVTMVLIRRKQISS